jgi:hypothetical protein
VTIIIGGTRNIVGSPKITPDVPKDISTIVKEIAARNTNPRRDVFFPL